MDEIETLLDEYRKARDKLMQAVTAGTDPETVKALKDEAERKWEALGRAGKEGGR